MTNLNRQFYSSTRCSNYIVQNMYICVRQQIDDEVCLVCCDDCDDNTDPHANCRVCDKVMHISCLVRWFTVNNQRICPHCRSGWKFSVDVVENGRVIITTMCSIAGSI